MSTPEERLSIVKQKLVDLLLHPAYDDGVTMRQEIEFLVEDVLAED